MIISIYTFQNAINIGAYLQAFALKEAVHNICISNEIEHAIRFPFRLSLWQQRYDILSRHKNKEVFNIKRYKKFLSDQKLFEMCHKNEVQDRELNIFGSDSIWDLTEKTNGYVPEMFGIGINRGYKISYAGSFGTLKSKEKLQEKTKQGLMSFDKHAVRDENTRIILNSLGIDSQVVCDPTVLIDWDEYIDLYKDDSNKSPYIMVYGEFPEYIQNSVKRISEDKGLRLLSIGTYNSWCDDSIASSPLEFVKYVANAQYVITSMYHGTLLSMMLKKRFVSFFTDDRFTKAKTTFEMFGIEDRLIKKTDDVEKVFMSLDYETIDRRVTLVRRKSLSYLKEAIVEAYNACN